ncbi:protein-methionine sulfoxide oxidase mical3a isoform X27 [Denticeps clupeoides]|uniref:protein-methionine sulfoxide oxidase mical3a isoform X27 n=1 Tax=Denticeps clupeoides TaxID=299321 RepID=UPI0010A377BB|nr:F-actin-monooxygenase MICAL3 isoform X27 [Denticeps clupeoides]
MGDGGGGGVGGEHSNQSHVLFDRFVGATTCKGTLKAFQELCDFLELRPTDTRIFYHKLKSRLNYWKAKALWAKLDKRASHKDYKKGRACANTKCLIIGAGPCGLRTAIELGLLGAKVVLLEKRDAFSRNNVLHLWPFTIQDLRGLGAKKFYGKFCAGAIDHISIRQLQLMLLKMALLLGVEIHVNVEFKGLIEPPEDQENERIGWRAEVHPRTHPVNELEFDVIIGADGRRNTLSGFRRKEFRGKLAIAITANFINRNTTAEAKVEEISGVAFIFNQKFFQDLREATGIDLENIVYYKDDTHYFVMTAKKQSLLDKGVILHDYTDTEMLLSRSNVDQMALLSYAREAADFSTNHQLPTLDFAINHYGQPDVAMFDFTCMYASENAALVRQRNGHQLLVALVGDSLLEPFWPMGTGIARGFLAAMDSAWMVRSWAQGSSALEVLAERESIYRLLPQTTPENVSKNFSQYSVDPTTRYPNISLHLLRPNQVRHLLDAGGSKETLRVDIENVVNASTPKLTRNESIARSSKLLNWCQRQTEGYRGVSVTDLTMSWKSGLALCAIIHRYRPDLIDFDALDERNVERNNQLGFDVSEREFGISPIMTGKEMSAVGEPDKLSMVMYLSQFYEMFKDMVPPGEHHKLSPEEKAALVSKSPISFLSKLGQSIAISRKRNPKDKKEKDVDGLGKRRKTSQAGQSEEEELQRGYHDDRPSIAAVLAERKVDSASAASANHNNKVRSMATQLLAKFEENAPPPSAGLKRQGSLRKEFPQNIGGSDVCFFCRKRVYVMERLSAEGKFFHRSCFKCDHCGTTLRLSSYAFDVEDGKFYCKPHYCYRVSGQAQRKRPAPTAAAPRTEENQAASAASSTVDSAGRTPAAAAPAERRPSAPELNGTAEPSVAKRLRGTPERIELENYRLSLQREEELEEVPEETLAEHNLSSVLDKATDIGDGSSSSESDMEEEDEEEEQQPGPSDPWKGASEHRVNLNADPGRSAEGGEAVQAGAGARCGLDGEMEEEEDEEDEDEEEEEESSDEGDYYPWQQELQGGLWLHSLADEEDSGTFKAGNLRVQQALQPIDPAGVVVGVSWQGGQENPSASASLQTPPSCSTAPLRTSTKHEAVRAWLDSLSGEPCGEEEDPEAEAGSPNMGPGTELDEDDIPSDAEAEAQLHQGRGGDLLVEENSHSESSDRVSSLVAEPSSDSPKQLIVDVVLSPVLTSEAEPEICTETQRLKSPGDRFFPEPFLLEDTKPLSPSQIVVAPGSVLSPVLKSPLPIASPILLTPSTSIMSPVLFPMPAVSTLASQSPTPIASPVLMTPGVTSSPICSPPFTLPETVSSPVQSQPCACSPSSNPLSPICSQPAPCHEMSSPISSSSPVRTQPVPAVASTPLPKSTADESNASLEETPVKKADIIEEFWLKSAEIRKSLGLTPLDRSRPLEKSSMLTAKVPTPDPSSPKSYTPEDTSEDLKPTFTGRSIIRRLNITVEGQVISPVEPKSNDSERRDLSSSSGLGLNGSIATSQTAASESYNTSDSTMLTPPSSPPPPPPRGEEPATLKHKRYQVAWDKVPVMDDLDDQPKPIPTKAEPKKQTSPPMSTTQAPIPAPRTITVNSSVVMRREAKPRRTEVRKSFAESVEEIPFADDVEDTYDERTAEAGMQSSLYTPPTSKASRDRPPLHLALSMENGKPNIPKPGRSQHFSPEAKEIAEERIRAREKSVKSQALKDAMAKQLRKMESDVPKDTFHKTRESDGLKGAAKVAWSVSETTVKDKKPSGSPKMTAVKSLESKKQPETLPERFFTMAANKSLDSSVTSSESSSGGKSKKRSSLFSPRKNKKEKKAKNENRTSGPEETPPKHKSLWKAVFSGYKKDKKKKEDKSCPSTPSSSTTVDSGKKKTSPLGRSSDLRMRRNISFSEDSDLSCDDVLERSSQKSKADRRVDLFDLVSDLKKDAMKEKEEREKERERLKEKERRKERKKTVQKGNEEESVYVPHALAFKRSYATKKTYTEEELNAKLTRRVQKAARRQAKQEELKRLHRAQIIQRQLEQVEEKQRQLEERGVAVEKALRGEAGLYKGSNVSPKQHKRRSDYWGESHYSEILDLHLGVESSVRSPRRRPLSFCPCCSPAGMGKKDDPKLMQEWFKLVQEKNALVRYESELMIFARELELEDRQSRLQQELRERMAVEDHLKTEKELAEEKQILNEMLEVVEQRDSLVALLEEQRLREKEEDKDLEAVMLSKGFNLNWA